MFGKVTERSKNISNKIEVNATISREDRAFISNEKVEPMFECYNKDVVVHATESLGKSN